MSTKALILVGGDTRGTRFRPLSLDIPKVLFPVAGKPLLSHAIDAVAQVPSMKEILLIGFYDDSVFQNFITETSKKYPKLTIRFLREYKAMGTAGGIYHFRDQILKGHPSRFYVIHADVCCSFPLNEINDFFDETGAKTVIMGTRVPSEDASNYGVIVANEKKQVIHYVEKPESYISNLINGGVYLFDTSIFEQVLKAKLENERKAYDQSNAEEVDIDNLKLETEILSRLPETRSFFVYETKDFWRQIKSAGSALPANALYLQQLFQNDPKNPNLAIPSAQIIPPVYIDPSATVDRMAKLGPNVSIGPGSVIGPGVRINDSIILDDTEIKHDACILHAVISKGCRIGAWARVEGTAVSPSKHSTTIVRNGIKTESVTILSANVNVADEVKVRNAVVLPHKDIKSDVSDEVIM